MKKRFYLQLFEVSGGTGSSEQGENTSNNKGNTGGTYSYEQAEEIANARADKAERAALANYFRSQGMTEDEITTAISDFKAKRQATQLNISQITQERDDALKKVMQYENEKILSSKGVKSEDLDYVAFKVAQLVTDKKDFKTAADEYLKENPRFTGKVYQVSTGISSGAGSSGTASKNEQINNMIRNAFGR